MTNTPEKLGANATARETTWLPYSRSKLGITKTQAKAAYRDLKVKYPFIKEYVGKENPYTGAEIKSRADYMSYVHDWSFCILCEDRAAVYIENEVSKRLAPLEAQLEEQSKELEKSRRKCEAADDAIRRLMEKQGQLKATADKLREEKTAATGEVKKAAAALRGAQTDAARANAKAGRMQTSIDILKEERAAAMKGLEAAKKIADKEQRTKGRVITTVIALAIVFCIVFGIIMSNTQYDSGYTDGELHGREEGLSSGHAKGYEEGHGVGYELGYDNGYTSGYKKGYLDGHGNRPSSPTNSSGSGYTGTGTPREDPIADTYIGNKNTKKFHLPTCSYLPNQSNQVTFDTWTEAVDRGYSPCGHCDP